MDIAKNMGNMGLVERRGARITLKGVALLIAIENGLVKKRFSKDYDITAFMRFWDDFSEAMENFEYNAPNVGDVFKEHGDSGSDDEKNQIP